MLSWDWHSFFMGGPGIGVTLPGIGVHVPGFIIACCLLLLACWFLATLGMLKVCKQLERSFIQLKESISNIKSESDYLDAPGIKEVRSLLNGQPVIEEAFQEFEKTLLYERKREEKGAKVYSSCRLERYLEEEKILSSRIHKEFYTAVPALLTSAGLLVTFLAILLGLSEVSVDDISGKVQGVNSLVSNLSGKFLSSVVALALALAFTLIEKHQTRKITRYYRDFLNTLASRIQVKTIEQIIRDQVSVIYEQHKLHKRAFSDLPGLIRQGIEEGIASAVDRVTGFQLADKIDLLLERLTMTASSQAEATSQQVSTMLSQMDKALSKLHQDSHSSTESVKTTADTMLKALDANARGNIESMHEAFTLARIEMEKSLDSFREATKTNTLSLNRFEQSALAVEKVSIGASTLVKELSAAQQSAATLVEAAQKRTEELNGALERSSLVLEQYRDVFNVLDEQVGGLLDNLATNLQNYSQTMKESMDGNIKCFDEMSGTAASSLSLVVGELGEVVQDLTETLSQQQRAK